MSDIVLCVENIGKCYPTYRNNLSRFASWFGFPARHISEYWAVRDVSFSLRRGESAGLIGRNGAGKSTLLKLITGTIRPSAGTVQIMGRVSAILELGLGFNPDLTGRQNIQLAGGMIGLGTQEISDLVPEIEAFADLGQFFDQPLRIYSSGMQARLAFALATCKQPDVLIVDEVLSVGDAAFQRKCFRRIEEFLASGTSLLFVSHDIESVRRLCSFGIFLKDGRVVKSGPAKEVCDRYERDTSSLFQNMTTEEIGVPDDAHGIDYFDEHIEKPDELAYGNGRAEIIDRWIERSGRKKVNVLVSNEPFSWCYRIRFNDFFRGVTVAMRIKTVDGIGVFGTHKKFLKVVKPGDEVNIRIALTNHLAPGKYFLNCAVLDAHDELEFLHRRVDTYVIKVVDKEPGSFEGLVDLEPRFHWSSV